jgi:hypothetical protein
MGSEADQLASPETGKSAAAGASAYRRRRRDAGRLRPARAQNPAAAIVTRVGGDAYAAPVAQRLERGGQSLRRQGC